MKERERLNAGLKGKNERHGLIPPIWISALSKRRGFASDPPRNSVAYQRHSYSFLSALLAAMTTTIPRTKTARIPTTICYQLSDWHLSRSSSSRSSSHSCYTRSSSSTSSHSLLINIPTIPPFQSPSILHCSRHSKRNVFEP